VALLPAVCGLHYLNTLEECNYNVLHLSLPGERNNDASFVGKSREETTIEFDVSIRQDMAYRDILKGSMVYTITVCPPKRGKLPSI
jgi:hypothetical protein